MLNCNLHLKRILSTVGLMVDGLITLLHPNNVDALIFLTYNIEQEPMKQHI